MNTIDDLILVLDGLRNNKIDYSGLKSIYKDTKKVGYNEVQAASAVINAAYESGGNPLAIQKGGPAMGRWQLEPSTIKQYNTTTKNDIDPNKYRQLILDKDRKSVLNLDSNKEFLNWFLHDNFTDKYKQKFDALKKVNTPNLKDAIEYYAKGVMKAGAISDGRKMHDGRTELDIRQEYSDIKAWALNLPKKKTDLEKHLLDSFLKYYDTKATKDGKFVDNSFYAKNIRDYIKDPSLANNKDFLKRVYLDKNFIPSDKPTHSSVKQGKGLEGSIPQDIINTFGMKAIKDFAKANNIKRLHSIGKKKNLYYDY